MAVTLIIDQSHLNQAFLIICTSLHPQVYKSLDVMCLTSLNEIISLILLLLLLLLLLLSFLLLS